MKLRPSLFCCLLLLSLFAAKMSAQGAPPAGSIEIKVLQAIDSDKDVAGQQFLALVTQKVSYGDLTITQGTSATLTLAKAADGNVAVQLTSIRVLGQPRAVTTNGSPVVTGSLSSKAALGRAGGNAQGTVQAAVAPIVSGARIFLPAGTSLQFQFSIAGVNAPPPAAAAAPGAPAAPALRPSMPAPVAQPVPASVAPTQAAQGAQGKIFSAQMSKY